ncbi:peptide ABC transporter substrate-binding protein [Candidatus Kuenenbacteria bacterium]|nr:peptide ABC transporter substrate-binding protein [Candidatus Kuenenbacteria bacterium]
MSSFKTIWVKFKTAQFKLKEKLTQKKLKRFHQHDEQLVQKLSSSKKRLPSVKQLGFVSKYLSKTELLIIRVLSGVIIIAVICVLLNVYWTHSNILPKEGGSYTEGLVGSPHYINPLFAQANDVDHDISALVFSSLFKFTNDGLIKDLVKEYQISDDQKKYTVELRQDIKWQDGEALDADDVIFTFSRISNTKTKTPLFFNFQGAIFERIDDYKVSFTLNQPFAPFLESLTVGILPEHIWQNILPENMMMAEYNLKPVGSGPYKFKSLVKNKNGVIKSFKLEKNKEYYEHAPYINDITFKFHEDFDQVVEGLNNKNTDGISYLPKEIRTRIINNRNLNFHLLHLPQYTAVFFNYANTPILKDVKMRKILSHAVDKEKIVNETLNAEAQIIDTCILEGSLGYNSDIVKYPYNVNHAKNELEKAGWKLADYETKKEETTDENKEEGETEEKVEEEKQNEYAFQVRKLKDRYLEFNLTTVNQPETVEIAKTLQKEWQQIGAKVNLIIVNADKMQEVIKNRDYQALLYGQILGYDPDPYPFWHSSQKNYPGLNLTSLVSPSIDTLLEEARKTSDDTARAKKYQEFQKILADTVPAIFLFNPTYTYPQSKKIKGFDASTIITPSNRFNQIHEWYIKTSREWN